MFAWLKLEAGKSGKRETAVALLMLWALYSTTLFWFKSPDEIMALKDVYSTISTAVFVFATGAFGLHAWQHRPGADKKGGPDGSD